MVIFYDILGTNICIYYPDCGELQYKLLFNHLIKPRQHNRNIDLDAIHLLFCFEPGKTFSLIILFFTFSSLLFSI